MFVRIDACISEQQTDTLSVMSHTTASPKYTLALTKILISPEGSNDLPHFAVLIRLYDNPIDTNCLKNISLYFCRAQSPYFCIKHHPLLRTRFLIDLRHDVPAEGEVLLLRFEFCLVGSALRWISEDGACLRLGCC